MSIVQSFLPELNHEMATTRRVLEVVPGGEAEWRPHPKSSSLGGLAAHITALTLWGSFVARQSELDLGVPANTALAQIPFTTTAELLDRFDRYVREMRGAVEQLSDTAMGETWTLKNRGATIFALPRVAVLRSFIVSHMIHHRGQLTVYLRLRDVPLPSVYGPTADAQG
jgi:uncharacterized damage-inducible protein DinB